MPAHRIAGVAATTAAALAGLAVAASPAQADGPVVVGGGNGTIDTSIHLPGSPGGSSDPITQPVGGGNPGASPAVTCQHVLDTSNPASHPGDYPGLHDPGHVDGQDGSYYYRYCSDGSTGFVWVPNGAASATPGVPTVTPAQLALEARDRLVLTHPTVHRSPTEANAFHGDPYTWVNLWTWVWTNPGDYRPLSQTVSVGPISATTTARPVGLLFESGDGNLAVRCAGPGRAWTDADGNAPPPSGCGYQYRHAADTPLPARLGILWQVSWTGTGGMGGTLPPMETITASPLRVLQAQVVSR